MAHRMFISHCWSSAIVGYPQRTPNRSLQPVTKLDKLFGIKEIRIHIGCVLARHALIVLGHLTVVYFQAVQSIATLGIGVGLHPRAGLDGFIEIRRTRVSCDDGGIEIVRLDF